jgi:hypothetical protein
LPKVDFIFEPPGPLSLIYTNKRVIGGGGGEGERLLVKKITLSSIIAYRLSCKLHSVNHTGFTFV